MNLHDNFIAMCNKLILIVLSILLPIFASGQGFPSDKPTPYELKHQIKDPQWQHQRLSPTKYVMYNKNAKEYYYGAVKFRKYEDGNIREGEGVTKRLTEMGREYFYGTWKGDHLDGIGLVKREDGTAVAVEFSRGLEKRKTERPLTEEESAVLDNQIELIETALRRVAF